MRIASRADADISLKTPQFLWIQKINLTNLLLFSGKKERGILFSVLESVSEWSDEYQEVLELIHFAVKEILSVSSEKPYCIVTCDNICDFAPFAD
jgi:hypothetical protein